MVGQPAAGVSEPLEIAATACGRGRRPTHPDPGRTGRPITHGRAGLAGQCDGFIEAAPDMGVGWMYG